MAGKIITQAQHTTRGGITEAGKMKMIIGKRQTFKGKILKDWIF